MNIYSLPVAKFMVKKVITATISQTIQSVCRSMYDNNFGCLVIVKMRMKGLVPVGIIMERDIVKIIGSTDFFIGQAPIREFMSYPLITGNPTTTISQAIEIMNAKKIHRLPIIDNNEHSDRLIGIISDRDILMAIGKSKKDYPMINLNK